ncbi:MarR family transcriptional regulator [Streptomyces sp. R1]|uniref:MarR family winged helix-turn-helix transcriptional regulator n=1 Tax=Streptomyces TaxID=1883 RepID=UPI00077675C7|nr:MULTISPECIES: MarR family transcriptional regulator [unclassified Streptomyces]MCC8340572.1 MarR family transcriptional regulator [Streptomyces sp. R1]MDA4888106.1 MarR family transcriptional regulator [Streptomyces sp. MS2A]
MTRAPERSAGGAGSAAEAGPSLLYLLKRTELVVRARLEELLKPAGVTALQYTALTVLERHDGISAAQLARDSFVTAQSMADMVRGLESRGLVRREPNPGNRREKVILLADAGRRLLAEHAEPARMLEQRMVADLGPADVERFRDALKSAHRALS